MTKEFNLTDALDRADAASSLHRTRQANTRILNCVPSLNREDDWGVDTAVDAGVMPERDAAPIPPEKDLREPWWTVRNQEQTGACVGFACADGVLRWHYVKAGLLKEGQLTSPRFVWMANKETDEITEFPTTFVESAGTQTKRALLIALRYGCVLERELPMKGGTLWQGSTAALYSRAAGLRIESFYNLGTDLDDWRRWLANNGPILTRLSVDDAFMHAGNTAESRLDDYDKHNTRGGHAVAIVGYGPDYFIIRNSWGTAWGHGGFAYATVAYTQAAFTEAYGVVVPKRNIKAPPNPPIPPSWDTHAEVLTDPRFEGITIELAEGEGEPSKRAAAVAREVLGDGHAWRIERVHPSEPLDYDLLPPLGLESETSVAGAWQLTHSLKALPDVAHAEPSFVLYQDNDPNLLIPGTADLATAAAEGNLTDAQLNAAGLPVVEPSWRDWSPLFIRAREAWDVVPRAQTGAFAPGKAKGEGVRVGHPDSGYRSHKELWNSAIEPRRRILKELDRDFVDNDLEPMTDDGNHGLATASVIMSYEPKDSGPDSPLDEITGVAPRADLVPLRVAKVRPIIPTPVLLRSGMIRLRRAIDYGAAEAGCHVFSISLGWLWNRSVHKAIRRAVNDHNAIVVAAAGNYVRFVVWPAHYRETVCIAACNFRGGKWSGSSRGSRVDVTAPGEDVWKADHDEVVKTSSGTSYSTASVAGLAALWLAHWGRDFLLDKYPDTPLNEVFRWVLKHSSTRPDGWNIRKWGSGIVDAKALLKTKLPDLSKVKDSMRRKTKSQKAADTASFPELALAFESLEPDDIEARVARLMGVGDTATVAGLEDELMFHVLTTPALRDAMTRDSGRFDEQADGVASSWAGSAQFSDRLKLALGA
jgi:hypothetical protein